MSGLAEKIRSSFSQKVLLILSMGILSCSNNSSNSPCFNNSDCPGGPGQTICMHDGLCYGPGKSCQSDSQCQDYSYTWTCGKNHYCTINGNRTCGGKDSECYAGEKCVKYYCVESTGTGSDPKAGKFNTSDAAIASLIAYAKAGDLEKVRSCFDPSSPDAKQLTPAQVKNIADILDNSQMQPSLTLGGDAKVIQQDYLTPNGEMFFMILYYEKDGWRVHDI